MSEKTKMLLAVAGMGVFVLLGLYYLGKRSPSREGPSLPAAQIEKKEARTLEEIIKEDLTAPRGDGQKPTPIPAQVLKELTAPAGGSGERIRKGRTGSAPLPDEVLKSLTAPRQ